MFRRRKKKAAGEAEPEEVEVAETAETGSGEDAGGPVATDGPFDAADAPDDDVRRLDLGSLRIPVRDGINLQLQGDQQGNIRQVVLVHEQSALQLAVMAAPRTEDIWDEVREDILAQIHREGGKAKESDGEYGAEVRAELKDPKGAKVQARFVGIGGPRWLLRAVYQGKAATDDAAALPLTEILQGVVVDRGTEAMPVREPLPLRLPKEMAERARRQAAASGNSRPPSARRPSPGGASS